MKKAIVTGGAGFVGNALVTELLAHNIEVIVPVRPGFVGRNLNKNRLVGQNVRIVECDLQTAKNFPALIPDRDVDVLYHLAWDGLFHEALTDYKTQISNIQWTMEWIETASLVGCKKFIGAGSISQYELLQSSQGMYGYDKHRVYKTAKQSCEYMGRSVATQCGLTFIWPIITNIYGAGETSPRLINSMIRNLLDNKHQSLSEGNQIYDFIYSSDAAKAFRLMGEKGIENRIYTIAQGNAQPLKNFLIKIKNIVNPASSLGFGELDFNGVYLDENCYDISSLVEDTGFIPEISFEEGIKKTAEWITKERIQN